MWPAVGRALLGPQGPGCLHSRRAAPLPAECRRLPGRPASPLTPERRHLRWARFLAAEPPLVGDTRAHLASCSPTARPFRMGAAGGLRGCDSASIALWPRGHLSWGEEPVGLLALRCNREWT